MTVHGDRPDEMPVDLDDEFAFDLLLQGYDLGDHPLTDFAEDVWVATDGPVPPASPALAALLLGRPPETTTVTSLAEERRPWRARTAARIAALGVAAKAAVAAAVAVTGVATAGATGLLPQPVEDIVLPVIELITPLDLGSNDTVDPPRSTGGDGANPTGGSGTGTGTTGPGEAGDQPGAVDGRRPGSVPATVQADGTAGSTSVADQQASSTTAGQASEGTPGHGGTTPGEAGTVTSEPAAPLVAGGTPTSNPGEGPTTSTPPTTVEPTPTSGPPPHGGPRPTAGPPPAHTLDPPADHGPSDPHAGPPAHASGPPADTGRAEPTAGPPADPGAPAYSARPEGRPDSPGTGERPSRPTASDGRAGGTNGRGIPAPAAASRQHQAPAH